MVEFVLPEVGEGVEEGLVVGVLVKVGDVVAVDSPLLELETDKAVVEVPSNVAGTVKTIYVEEGQTLPIGGAVMQIAGVADEASDAAEAKEGTEDRTPSQEDLAVYVPEVGEGVESGLIVSLLAQEGQDISENEGVLELETDKAVVEMPSPVSGRVSSIHVKEGEEVAIGALVMHVSMASQQAAPAAPAPSNPSPVAPTAPTPPNLDSSHSAPAVIDVQTISNAQSIPAAPSVRRLARELAVDLKDLKGSGILGRISAEDVRAFASGSSARSSSQAAPSSSSSRPAINLPDFSRWGDIERVAMSGIRKATARQMDVAWSAIPMVTHFDRADITDFEATRKRLAKRVEQAGGGKLTPTAMISKIVANALAMEQFRDFNASVDGERQEIIYKNYVHLGIAVDTPRGLIVPVIRNANGKSVVDISKDLNDLASRGRAGKVALDEMQGGTFSISNLGGIGGYGFTPIVNHPEVAILGISRGQMEPKYNPESGQFEPRMMMGVSLSYDHRLIDGAAAARFCRWICEAIEEPFLLVLES